jgi:hypothetical protein
VVGFSEPLCCVKYRGILHWLSKYSFQNKITALAQIIHDSSPSHSFEFRFNVIELPRVVAYLRSRCLAMVVCRCRCPPTGVHNMSPFDSTQYALLRASLNKLYVNTRITAHRFTNMHLNCRLRIYNVACRVLHHPVPFTFLARINECS